jgi:hypothetical protein
MASYRGAKMTAEESRMLVEAIRRRFDRGLSQSDTVLELHREYFDSHINPAPNDLGSIVTSCYGFMEKSKGAKDRAEKKETKAVALYDALIALGWTPPA